LGMTLWAQSSLSRPSTKQKSRLSSGKPSATLT
jgi:hypothetical protein